MIKIATMITMTMQCTELIIICTKGSDKIKWPTSTTRLHRRSSINVQVRKRSTIYSRQYRYHQ